MYETQIYENTKKVLNKAEACSSVGCVNCLTAESILFVNELYARRGKENVCYRNIYAHHQSLAHESFIPFLWLLSRLLWILYHHRVVVNIPRPVSLNISRVHATFVIPVRLITTTDRTRLNSPASLNNSVNDTAKKIFTFVHFHHRSMKTVKIFSQPEQNFSLIAKYRKRNSYIETESHWTTIIMKCIVLCFDSISIRRRLIICSWLRKKRHNNSNSDFKK